MRLVSVTPTLDTSAYSNLDRMGSIFEIPGVGSDNRSEVRELTSLSVLDKSNGHQNANFLLHLFNASPAVASADNAALDISDAELAAKYLGTVEVASANYNNLAGSSVASLKAIGLILKVADGSTSLYGILQSKGAPTFAASDLVLNLGFK